MFVSNPAHHVVGLRAIDEVISVGDADVPGHENTAEFLQKLFGFCLVEMAVREKYRTPDGLRRHGRRCPRWKEL
jgi:hypothetical protein